MRDFTAEGATHIGRVGQRPECRICRQIFTSGSAACTAVGDHPVRGSLLGGLQLGPDAALAVGREAAGDDHAHAAAGAFGEEGGHPLEAVLGFFQAGVHRAHQDPVLQCREAQVERGEEVRIAGVRCVHAPDL
jgi:hypothetical protein